jgi:hypothetical protein
LYPNHYDQLPYPRGYRVLEFSKFSGDNGKTTLEHVGQFILQCGEASANDALKLRMFPLSLNGTVFTWFTSLAPNSILTWAQLKQKFHEYFILAILRFDYHILLPLSKNIMIISPSTLGDLGTLGTIALT